MKAFLKFLFVFAITCIPYVVMAQEYYFRFIEKDKDRINTIVTSTVSIDNLRSDTVYAYANPLELEAIKKLGYELEILPHPSSLTKNRIMATTVDEMADWDRYPTYEVYREMMKKFEKDYPALCKLDSIGTSIQGRKLYVVKISDNVLVEEAEPEFFYTSTMHGDETTGYILMLRLIDYLLSNYGVDARVTNLVNNIAIFINPNANPDGTYYGGNHTVDNARRSNANSKDLNRNFPDPRVGSNPDGAHQPETVAMMNYAEERNFVLSANFHGGIELVNYPWDTWTSSANSHADHNWFYTISRQYANNAQANSPSGYFTAMDNGVTHGGDWYVISGGRQDYMNYWHNCREVTLEISNTKNPASGDLPNYWDYNMEAMLSYMELVFAGVGGAVTNSMGEPLNATISIADHDKDNSFVVTNPLHGNYLRMIEPGEWELTFSAEGYKSQKHTVNISSYSTFVNLDVVLSEDKNKVTFIVNHTDGPVPNASVSLADQAEITDSSGEAIFEDIPSGTYDYTIIADGYDEMEGTVTVEDDIEIEVELILVGIPGNSLNSLIKIWPNPFAEQLEIEVNLNLTSNLTIEIFTVTGQKVKTLVNSSFTQGIHNFKWAPTHSPSNQLSEGLFIIKISTSEGVVAKRAIFSPGSR